MTDPQNWAAPGANQPGAPYPPQGTPPPGAPQNPGYQNPGYQQPGSPYPGGQYPGAQYPGAQYPGAPGGPGTPPGPGAVAPKPGVIPLRPLGVGEILDGAIAYIRANPVATLGLAAIVVTITQLVEVPLGIFALGQLAGLTAAPGDPADPTAIAGVLVGSVAGSAVGALVSFVAITVLSGMLIAVLSQAVLGHKMSIGAAWAAVRSRIPGLVGLTLLIALLLVLVAGVGVVPLVVLAVMQANAAVVVLVGVLFVLLSWAVALFLGVSWALAAPAYVLEGVGVTAAMRRSFQLVRKQWWRVFGISLLGGIIAVIIGAILSLPFSFAADPMSDPIAGVSIVGLLITSVGTIVATTVTAPFSAGITGLLYFDQRIRREGLDIELARTAQQG
ncbi:glycerophosphoryl diester phosphodiesterase family protein [Pseudonocardia cypriaca]|uniref:Glycerophosphoryl diester phosphodiesterase family protein n=1 Tax=Pseudonocardia cypriaca TaxID=882449 RepID=A0A543FRT3_9PSEU|nr:glycerophosphoryl diester phosphodiesterase family protein [Pseudonocardia cypriaca]